MCNFWLWTPEKVKESKRSLVKTSTEKDEKPELSKKQIKETMENIPETGSRNFSTTVPNHTPALFDSWTQWTIFHHSRLLALPLQRPSGAFHQLEVAYRSWDNPPWTSGWGKTLEQEEVKNRAKMDLPTLLNHSLLLRTVSSVPSTFCAIRCNWAQMDLEFSANTSLSWASRSEKRNYSLQHKLKYANAKKRRKAHQPEDLPLGSPIAAVAPPTIAIGRMPKCAVLSKFTITSKFPMWRLLAVGSNPA